jgi:hypothetical protein
MASRALEMATMRRLDSGTVFAAALALILGMSASQSSRASTVIDVVPGAGSVLGQGALCLAGSPFCPSIPPANATDLNLQSPSTVTGGFVFTPSSPTSGTMSLTLTLTSNATFGTETLLAGATFTASNIDVTESVSGGMVSISQVAQTGPAIVSNANMSFMSGLSVIENTPVISNLNCLFSSGGGQCGVALGGGSLGSGLEFGPDPLHPEYNGFLGFSVAVTPVPLPPSLWLMLGGLGCFVLLGRRARPAKAAIRF